MNARVVPLLLLLLLSPLILMNKFLLKASQRAREFCCAKEKRGIMITVKSMLLSLRSIHTHTLSLPTK
jgi:hypothetical protein